MMDRDFLFQSVDDGQEFQARGWKPPTSIVSCHGTWQRVARRQWRDHLLSWFGWYPWQCSQCLACTYYRCR